VKWLRTGYIFNVCAWLVSSLAELKKADFKTNLEFFRKSNSLANGKYDSNIVRNFSLDVVFVATEKDFQILKFATQHAMRVTSSFKSRNLFIVVPDESLGFAVKLIGDKECMSIIPESEIVSREILEILRVSYGARANWIYQQLLKVEFIRKSTNPYCLVIDADTILLNPRQWIDANKRTGLTPTDEAISEYHQFLYSIGVISQSPTVSFVPHHMFYDVEKFKNLVEGIGFINPATMLLMIDKHVDKSSASPISIDYELYGQWMLTENRPYINLIKWSNLGIARSKAKVILNSRIFTRFIAIFYNSISFHDYS
jgi:hypothetical protein